MEQCGIVIEIVIDIVENKAKVLIKTKSGCGDCTRCTSSCTTSTTYVYADNTINAEIGDKVHVTMEKSSYNKMLILAYLFPTISLIIGIFIGVYVFKNELLAILIGFTMCIFTYILFGKFFKNDDYEYKLTKMID